MNHNLKLGSLLYRSKGIVEHVGVYLGLGWVLHSVPDTGVSIVKLETFGNGKTIKVSSVDDIDADTLALRISQILSGDKRYSLSQSNCQHIANFIVSGRKMSPQLRWTFGAALLAAFFAWSRGYNPIPFLLLGGVVGCLGYSASLEFDGQIAPISH